MGAMDVAVKQLRPGAPEEDKIKFLQEAAINGQFKHPNVVKLMGVVTTGEPVSTLKVGKIIVFSWYNGSPMNDKDMQKINYEQKLKHATCT